MIHELLVNGTEQPKELRKTARRMAMTGGYEVRLSPDLTGEQLADLVELYRDELSQYPEGSAAYNSSLAGRLLRLIEQHKACPESLRARISELMPAGGSELVSESKASV